MPLKDSTETKMAVKNVEEVGWGSWSDLVWIVHGRVVGVGGSPRVPSSGIPGEEDQVGPCEQLDALSPFKPFERNAAKGNKIHGPDPIVSTP
ncbi:ATP synthase subunit beta, chloroplastic [Quillaja saponaria]|uniref:ATP synthase subunit beta, chloroplastic n=1 Tax=Quillaja saponaria TaxID=32244 RepID=A0AAD7P4U4_QUISA|nr:ATP synthase subunit beta, chloroplastic [Quillaja saponaria]